MAEKGNIPADAAQIAAATAGSNVERVVERTTQEITTTLAQTGDTLRDKVIETTADHAIEETRERLKPTDEGGAGGDGAVPER